MKLYGYWRSSASYRVRIALNLKGLAYEYEPVHLVKDGGQQHSEAYRKLNPARLVPTFIDGDVRLNQSLAIIEYLEECYPKKPLLPSAPADKARVRALAYDLACELQPVTNLRVLQYLTGELNCSDEQRSAWIANWVERSFTAFEQRLTEYAGDYCYGNSVTLADICLIPQVYNAQRFNLDLTAYPTLMAVHERLQALDAVQQARPENQADAQ
ncbi:maleylacetoacetate isomerase [Idiomarina loihiensis]|uniref:Glutathione S-transferase related protein n=1 Tax=Idiomarina loihiensis (strain ATCC BAA-735 / DSM 15497 / L2-TR) TaxID=283942 RepID=Q5R0H1_IDILO|nr:maleylacetoacetate isomerase [Idiomarina loihiensis]AAV81560.1 Glutathione S-transferase related protein [Idiomarina loihiensis L2TR]AGM35588.1 glutathione S-transferase-like protein [Idiomarina loihiensis GSL 199]